jgi:hypothetical protein
MRKDSTAVKNVTYEPYKGMESKSIKRESVRVHIEGSLKVPGIKSSKAKTFLEELSVNIKLGPAGEVLPCNKRLDNFGNSALLVNINQRFQLHRCWERSETGEDFWICRRVEIASD